MSYPNERDCEHGHLRGKCSQCDDAEEIASLRSQLLAAHADGARMREALADWLLGCECAPADMPEDIHDRTRVLLKAGSGSQLLEAARLARETLECVRCADDHSGGGDEPFLVETPMDPCARCAALTALREAGV